MADFHLVRPWVLLGLLLLPILAWWLRKHSLNGHHWQSLLPAHLQSALLQGDREQKPLGSALPLALLALMLLSLSGPSWDRQPVPLYQLQQGRVMVMDLSYSMWATDLPPNRITQARFKALDLLEQLPEGEMGLVAYAGDAFALAPMTDDRATLANLIPVLGPELMPAPGSNLPRALYEADRLLRDAGYQQGEILLLIDDLLPEYADEVMDLAERLPWTLRMLTLGTREGAPMEQPNGDLVRDRAGQVALARTNFDLLARVAQASGGSLVRYQPDGSDVTALSQSPSLADDSARHDSQTHQQWLDRGGFLLPLLLLPFALLLRRHALLALLPLLMLTPSSEASWWQTQDQRGQAAFETGEYAEAAQLFDDPAWQGTAHYRAGQYEQALSAFDDADDLTSRYNAGNALAQLGDYAEAAERYRQVLAQQPDHADAQANLALMEQLQQEQSQQQGQGEQEGDGESGDDSQSGEGEQPPGDDSESGEQGDGANPDQPSEEQGQPDPSNGEGDAESEQGNDAQPDNQQAPEPRDSSDPSSSAPPSDSPEPSSPQSPDSAEPEPGQSSEGSAQPMNEQDEQTESQAEAQAAAAAESDGEQDELLQRQLRLVPDDPGQLLRNKMEREYQRRRAEGSLNRERTQW
ncbi:vWA domain-containing protein [Ferrimonas marina]|uniref:Ca-activated chloride channel family protein n=1 Tax=Ferrimonas marina TaxID=299255 RepID=A0A1M5YBR9_9GAMM|nr:VWA domain-containing protein [Ferrimonas marina]SHI08943.1 Ca-activated chloride channel family protein [Ferrimonas marina]